MKPQEIRFAAFMLLLLWACNNEKNTSPDSIEAGSDPNFTITGHTDEGLSSFNRKVVVFGIDIYAVRQVEDARLLHAANLLAQYLDNDEDGIPDHQAVVDKMVEKQAFIVMWKSEDDLDISPPDGRIGQDLGNDETIPSYVSNGKTGRFDAALEEVLHLITHAGYAKLYPDIFGEVRGSTIANAMDMARAGQFISVPDTYPSEAWYSYDDETCEYDCQVTEYHYWALTSILGAQENRLDEIGHEWKLNTREKVQNQDAAVFQLLTDPQYSFPTVLPDGKYRR
jgi:hypothetical protein